jgi:uncharacterized surface protein with fasciclin (FAS1) repeats
MFHFSQRHRHTTGTRRRLGSAQSEQASDHHPVKIITIREVFMFHSMTRKLFALSVMLIASAGAFAGSYSGAAKKDIVDTAVANGSFKTLAAALTAAGLVDTLKGDGPFTVFAPTDAAFEKLPAGTVEDLLKPENKAKLTAILTYHVVPGKVLAADVVKLTEAGTVQGGKVAIKVTDGKVTVDNANVTATDVMASNGVIHVIDTVLMPK